MRIEKVLLNLLYEFRRGRLKEENLFEEWYDIRADKIPGISKEERKEIEEYCGDLNVANEFADLSKENINRIEEFVEKVKERDALEMGYLCDKYYRFGFQDCKKLFFNI